MAQWLSGKVKSKRLNKRPARHVLSYELVFNTNTHTAVWYNSYKNYTARYYKCSKDYR